MSQPTIQTATAGILTAALLEMAMLAAPVQAADNAGRFKSDVIQSVRSGTPVTSNASPLHLSEAQRTRIAQALAGKDTEVDLNLKKHNSAKSFEPRIDEKIPKGLTGQAFPRPLITEMPPIRQYTYLKFKGQVLIVDPMTRKIVDMFPEQRSG
jgi:hypothetical protein